VEDDTDAESNASASAAGAVAGGNVTGSAGRELFESFESEDRPADCTVRRCNQIAFSTCTSKVKTKSFSTDGGDDCPCVRRNSGSLFKLDTDNGLVRLFGTVTLTFSAANCTMTTAGDTVTRTLTNFQARRGRKGRRIAYFTGTGTVGGITISAEELKDFDGNSHSGGGTLKKDSDNDGYDELTIAGIHRAGFTPSATTFADRKLFQSLFTDTGALIKLIRDTANYKATFGKGSKWTVMRNIIKRREDWEVTTDLVFKYDECDHPLEGEVKVTLKDGTSRTFTYTGKSCDDYDSTED